MTGPFSALEVEASDLGEAERAVEDAADEMRSEVDVVNLRLRRTPREVENRGDDAMESMLLGIEAHVDVL